ncbi:hypothetical protein AHiyo8_44610 [Arthrobacter sp. Hiyo8]|nr:hypothetical protein AHiyo8_44610 [Arthrobacter sp. Hiyo8]
MYLLLAAHPDGAAIQEINAAGVAVAEPRAVRKADLAVVVSGLEKSRPRWVWNRTQDWYPAMLQAGVELERCHDLTLCRAILVHSEFTAHTDYARSAEKLTQDDEMPVPPRVLQPPPPPAEQDALFEDLVPRSTQPSLDEIRAEFAAQQRALGQASKEEGRQHRLKLLLAAESAGAMIAAEMQFTGVPWQEALHEEILEGHLGPRHPPAIGRPGSKLSATSFAGFSTLRS